MRMWTVDATLEFIVTREGKGYMVTVESDGSKREGFFEVDPSVKSKMHEIENAIEEKRPLDKEFVENLGTKLFEMLFSSSKDLLHRYMDQSDHLTIILNMKDLSLHEIPWELCYDPENSRYLGADPQCSLVRRDQKSTQLCEKIDYPLKVLVIVSSPMDLEEKKEFQPDLDEIVDLMEPVKELEDKGNVKLDFLERTSIKHIQDKLKERYHIVHFVGHGFYDGKTKKGYLTIEDKNRNAKNLEEGGVAQLFGMNPPNLVIFTACESSPLIPLLLSRKVPAVLAMQYTVLKGLAYQFAERFYSLLVRGRSVMQAVSDARSAVQLEEGIYSTGWFTPVLYVRADDILQINTESPAVIPEKVRRHDMVTDLLGVENFVGRRKDLWLIEKALLEDNLKIAVVTGIGGIGKTALASKFVKSHKDMFRGVFAKKIVDAEMGVEEILGLLDRFLMEHGDRRLHDVGEADLDVKLERLNDCLKDRYLIVLDNFELLVKDEKIADKSMETFLRAFLSGDHSSKIMIISRYQFTFRDEIAVKPMRHVYLPELSLQDTMQFLGRLGIEHFEMKRRIYEKIGGNPYFLELFVHLAETRPVETLLEDVTPLRGKIGELLLNEMVELLTEEERKALKILSVFQSNVERSVIDVLDISDEVVDKLVYYSLVRVEHEHFFMHQGVRTYVYALLSGDEKIKIGEFLLNILMAEKDETAESNAKTILDNFDKLSEDVRDYLLLKLPEKEITPLAVLINLIPEKHACSLIVHQNYSEARSSLVELIERVPWRKQSLQDEFGFLYNFDASAKEDERRWNENKELIEWRKNLWNLLSDRNNFYPEPMDDDQNAKSQKGEEAKSSKGTSVQDEPVEIIDSSLDPQEKGEALERAVLELFQKFFIIAEENEEMILQKLRQQKKGTQFGHDISFECTAKGNENVKCHIECKNKKNGITLKDIADKLASTEAFCPDIDYWILISPRSNPSDELDILLSLWHEKKKYPFEIQIWCPNTGVKEFFGLKSDVYDLFYEPKEDETHPTQWKEEKRRKVFEKWKQKLKPVIRLPKEWEKYIWEPSLMFIRGDRTTVLKDLYKHYVPMRCMDERRNIIGQPLEQHMLEWLKDTKAPVMFLLGDFGDGKTAFTYIFSCNLAKRFIKDPATGWIPVRFALRDYHSAGGARGFLRGRLEEFRADIASWNILKEQYNMLVILDGFDEMTKKLDSGTVTRNIKDLIECCEEFEGLKILITSRRHFFENQKNVKRLLQRLPSNRTCYLVPIDRHTTVKHLEEYAVKLGEEKKLRSICKLHDPIGLASKPLFLQMVKETLDELPEENLDEVILYETYIEKSLTRKKRNLDDAALKVPPREIHSNLIGILEEVALRLQGSEENFVLLEEFVSPDEQNLAKLLWKMSESDEVIDELVGEKGKVVEDATARVGVRSLLTRIKTDDNTHKWPVDFCHRSMREYFVARGICRALYENKERAKKLLAKLPLNHEILYFAAELMRQKNAREYESALLSLTRSTRGTSQCGTLGGNAVTILYRLKGELPGDDWSELNLDGADLSGADLANKNFSGTSLRYANLDNVNFEGADFCHCDLTGVQIEETASVLAVAANHLGDRIIAAYGDNTIREWNISQRLKNEWKTIGRNTNGFINWIGTSPHSSLCALTNEEVIFYDFKDQGELLERARFRMKPEYRQVVVKENNLLLVSKKEHDPNKVLLIDLKQQKIRGSVELEKVALSENFDRKTFVMSEEGTSLRIAETTNSSLESAITLSAHEVTSLCVFSCKKYSRYLLACGQRNGEVFVWQIDFFKGKWKEKLLLKRYDHDDSVSSLAFLDDSRIISGGIDRKIFVIRFGSDIGNTKGKKENELHLTAKCRGMKIEGVKRDRERRMLETLISKAQ